MKRKPIRHDDVERLYSKLLGLADHTRQNDRSGTSLEIMYVFIAYDAAQLLGKKVPRRYMKRITAFMDMLNKLEAKEKANGKGHARAR
jgi:hypothetical protein